MTKRLCVVRLDNAKMGAGPGTVLSVGDEDIKSLSQPFRDKDDCLPDWIRFWGAEPNVSIGDRVSLKAT